MGGLIDRRVLSHHPVLSTAVDLSSDLVYQSGMYLPLAEYPSYLSSDLDVDTALYPYIDAGGNRQL